MNVSQYRRSLDNTIDSLQRGIAVTGRRMENLQTILLMDVVNADVPPTYRKLLAERFNLAKRMWTQANELHL